MSKSRLLLFTTPAVLALGVWIGHAIATGAPTQAPLTWSGTITDAAGKPMASAQDVTVSFYDAALAGTLKCKSSTVQSEAGTGRFTVSLPGDCVQAVHETADLWSETKVGATLLPRVHVGAVPYALEADTASNAGGALKVAVDGLKGDVAGLKAAPQGPWVYTGDGQELGRFVGPGEAFASATVETATGYILTMLQDGTVTNDSASFGYTEKGAEADFIAGWMNAKPAVAAKRLYWVGKKFFTPSAGSQPVVNTVSGKIQSNYECGADPGSFVSSVKLVEVPLIATGLPSAPPFYKGTIIIVP